MDVLCQYYIYIYIYTVWWAAIKFGLDNGENDDDDDAPWTFNVSHKEKRIMPAFGMAALWKPCNSIEVTWLLVPFLLDDGKVHLQRFVSTSRLPGGGR